MAHTLTAVYKAFIYRSWSPVHEYKEAHAFCMCLHFGVATGSLGLTLSMGVIHQSTATLAWSGLESSTWTGDGSSPTTSRFWGVWPHPSSHL